MSFGGGAAAAGQPVRETLSVKPCGFASSPEGGAFTEKGNLPVPPRSSPFGRAGASAPERVHPVKRGLVCCDLAVGQQQPMQLPGTPPPVKKQIRRGRSPAGFAKSKIIFPLKMPRATRRAFQIVSLAVTVTSSAASRRRRRHPPGTRRRKSRSCRRPTARPASGRWGTWPARADGALPPPRPHGCCRTR